jgi:hypothetical protein
MIRSGRRGMLSSLVTLVALAVVGLVLASTAGGAISRSQDDATSGAGMGPAHWFGPNGTYGNFNDGAPAPPVFSFYAVDNLANPGNNEIMPTTNTYVIFWLPTGRHFSNGTTAASDLDYENTVLQYFKNVGGSQILNTTTQYSGNNGTPADTSNFVTSIVDTTAYPHAGTQADPVTQSDNTTRSSPTSTRIRGRTGSRPCTSSSCRTASSTAATRRA